MLYTVIPPERIYRQQPGSQPEIRDTVETEVVVQGHRVVYLRREGNDRVISGVVSTDPSDYLSGSFEPGKIYLE